MFFVNAALNDISIGTAGLVALLGYAVVLVGLIALMAVVLVMGKIMVVGDREAAMLMAIVANKLGKPLNTLRFKSMKEVI